MDVYDVVQLDNTFQATFNIGYNSIYKSICSNDFVINSAVLFQVKVIYMKPFQRDASYSSISLFPYNVVLVKFAKRQPTDDFTYTMKLSIAELAITDTKFTADEGIFHLVNEVKVLLRTLKISVRMETTPSWNSFTSLYCDDELTDFEMRGDDGSVHVHRALLAAASPVLMRMLVGEWKETAEGHVHMPGETIETLQNLKKYIYCNTLPEKGLEELILLATVYMIPTLEKNCVEKIVAGLTAERTTQLLQFATKNNLNELLLSILKYVQNGSIKVDDIREFIMKDYVRPKSDHDDMK